MVFWLFLLLGTAWSAAAFWFKLNGAVRVTAWAALGLAAVGLAGLRLSGSGYAWAGLALCAVIVGGWFLSLRPSLSRDWAPDVARGVTGEVSGSIVTLHNVRNFRWHDRDHADERWETRSYNLDLLRTADMITSVWSSPEIAHLLVSFGFSDGQHIVFSVEIRRKRGEVFNSIGGFFRQFELALIAAPEDDIVKLRTNHRREDVRLFPLALNASQCRALLLLYVELGNRMAQVPVFYNTITSNCTTVVWSLAKVINPAMSLDWRLLLSGRLPEYMHNIGALAGDGNIAERRERARISAKALAAPEAADYSTVIRSP